MLERKNESFLVVLFRLIVDFIRLIIRFNIVFKTPPHYDSYSILLRPKP